MTLATPVNPIKRIIVAALLLGAAAVRLAGINDQLWLDEIWSINLARTAATVSDILFTLHHDNNHWINTLYVHFLGPGRAWWVYHIPAEVTGIGTVVVGWLLARRGTALLIVLGAWGVLVED